MKLNVTVKFTAPKYAGNPGLVWYEHEINANRESFDMDDFEKQSYALKIINDEFKAVVKRINERLLAEGFDEHSFRHPLMGMDENGKPIDLNEP